MASISPNKKSWSSLSKRKRTNPVNLTSGWLDAITEGADFPQLTDIGGALIIFNNLTCSDASEHTLRRSPIPYQLLGRERRYRVEDIVAYARRCLDEAPVRISPQRPRRKRIRPAMPRPSESPPDLLSVSTSLEINAKRFPKPFLTQKSSPGLTGSPRSAKADLSEGRELITPISGNRQPQTL
jgi:hypothetical protein